MKKQKLTNLWILNLAAWYDKEVGLCGRYIEYRGACQRKAVLDFYMPQKGVDRTGEDKDYHWLTWGQLPKE